MTEDVKRIADILHLQGGAFIAQKRCPYWYGCSMIVGDDVPCSGGSGLCVITKAADLIKQLTAELEQVKRERDAAVKELSRAVDACEYCGKTVKMQNCPKWQECSECCGWEWRGVCAENGDGADVDI